MRFFVRIQKLFSSRKERPLEPAGRVYDLKKIYHELNLQYFQGELDLTIGWFGRKKTSRTIRRKVLGYYDSRKKSIRIHRFLDSDFFPSYFISYVVYHEMLHHIEPPRQGNGRRKVHHRAFREKEEKFHSYIQAKQWEKTNLIKILQKREDVYGRS